MTVEPIPVRVTRYACPCCSRTHSSRRRAVEHLGRCWYSPGAKGCKTCKHFVQYLPADCDGVILYASDIAEHCAVGVNLAGSPECARCNGFGFVLADPQADTGTIVCPNCKGQPEAIKPGPIVHCGQWEAGEDQ